MTAEVLSYTVKDDGIHYITLSLENGRELQEMLLLDKIQREQRRYQRVLRAFNNEPKFAGAAAIRHAALNEGFWPSQVEKFERDHGGVVAKQVFGVDQRTNRGVMLFRAPGGRLFFRMKSLFHEVEELHLQQQVTDGVEEGEEPTD